MSREGKTNRELNGRILQLKQATQKLNALLWSKEIRNMTKVRHRDEYITLRSRDADQTRQRNTRRRRNGLQDGDAVYPEYNIQEMQKLYRFERTSEKMEKKTNMERTRLEDERIKMASKNIAMEITRKKKKRTTRTDVDTTDAIRCESEKYRGKREGLTRHKIMASRMFCAFLSADWNARIG
jgi:hypothetical protein